MGVPSGSEPIVDDIDATSLTKEQAAQILDAVRAHGVVVLKGQNLTRSQQVAFTAALGEVVVLPHSFEGKDPEPLHPAIQRVTNYFANGTWKGPGSNSGPTGTRTASSGGRRCTTCSRCCTARACRRRVAIKLTRAALATLSRRLRDGARRACQSNFAALSES